jgi:hypothetical protein
MSSKGNTTNAGSSANTAPYVNVKEETAYNTEANQNIGGSRKRKGKQKKGVRKSKKH